MSETPSITLPAQTMGDGTSAGVLSVFARGWNGYRKELIKTNPNLVFGDAVLIEAYKYLGDTSLQQRVEVAETKLRRYEQALKKIEALRNESASKRNELIRSDEHNHVAEECYSSEAAAYSKAIELLTAALKDQP